MLTTNLRKVGGSVMLALPPAILDMLHLEIGSTVGIAVEGDRVVIQPNLKPRYSLAELLDAGEPGHPRTPEEQEWLDSPAVGNELL